MADNNPPPPFPTPGGAVIAEAAAPPQPRREFLCTDDAAIRHRLVARACAAERARILRALPCDYKAAFRTVGFCRRQGRHRPVQILSPFDVPMGAARRAWLDAFAAHEANSTLEQMPHLVYWFDTSLETGVPHLTLETGASILSYEAGEQLNYDQIPKATVKKLLLAPAVNDAAEQSAAAAVLTESERLLCQTLTALERARKTGTPPVPAPPPEDELYRIVRAASEQLPATSNNNSSSSNTVQRQQQEAAVEQLPPQQPGMPTIGDRVKVYWDSSSDDGPDGNNNTVVYHAIVHDVRGGGDDDDGGGLFYFLIYDDGETQWLPLADHRFELVVKKKDGGGDDGAAVTTASATTKGDDAQDGESRPSDQIGAEASNAAGTSGAAAGGGGGTNRKKRKADDNTHHQVSSSLAADSDNNELDPFFKTSLDELKAYVAEHGHPHVRKACNKPLYYWIRKQRRRRQALPNRYFHNRIMTQTEIDALDALGFDWKFCAAPNPDSSNNNNDHTDVDLQQQQASSGKRRKTSTLDHCQGEEEKPEEDDAKMPAIEPARTSSVAVNNQGLGPNFIALMERAKAYKAEHGNMNVSFRDRSLYDWIKVQRCRFKALPNRHRQYRRISQAEIDALNAIGFDWGG